jgi:phosphatidylserine/phosphatidylglycerophosphate/cardiolipin synthase-like enzyme
MKFFNFLLGMITLTSSWAIDVTVSEAPDDTLALTVSAIKSAKKELLINIYELTSPDVAKAIKAQIEAGIKVRILEEGQPVGGFSHSAAAIEKQLIAAMKEGNLDNSFFLMKSPADKSGRRFVFDHAKYMVIDQKSAVVGSENYSPTGNPKERTLGNRGWEVWVQDPKVAKYFSDIFEKDTSLEFGDIELVESPEQISRSVISPQTGITATKVRQTKTADKPETLQACEVTPLVAPTESLSNLLSLIESSKTQLDIEQMSFPAYWGKNGEISPLILAVEAAARRGVKVRILLNDESAFNENKPSKNVETVKILNELAQKEQLPLQAQIANLQAMEVDIIHNKGVLVDGQKTLISSINWTENAIKNNREAAVIIQSKSISNHYQSLFNRDWELSSRR